MSASICFSVQHTHIRTPLCAHIDRIHTCYFLLHTFGPRFWLMMRTGCAESKPESGVKSYRLTEGRRGRQSLCESRRNSAPRVTTVEDVETLFSQQLINYSENQMWKIISWFHHPSFFPPHFHLSLLSPCRRRKYTGSQECQKQTNKNTIFYIQVQPSWIEMLCITSVRRRDNIANSHQSPLQRIHMTALLIRNLCSGHFLK